MFELVRRLRMFFGEQMPTHAKRVEFGLIMFFAFVGLAHGQDYRKVPISFLPPPLENATYSLGIYDAKSGKLVRRLQEIVPESAFTVGLNGLITSWDGKDDADKAVPPGRYVARGYAVGPMKIEGKQTVGNDWANDDEGLRIPSVQAIAVVPEDNGLVILARACYIGDALYGEQLARYGGAKTEFAWQKVDESLVSGGGLGEPHGSLVVRGGLVLATVERITNAYKLSDGRAVSPAPSSAASEDDGASSEGKNGTVWKVQSGILSQYSPTGERLRTLTPKAGEPIPTAVAAAKDADRLYILEESKSRDWQRVRGLSWKETTHDGDKTVSTWETFFEKSIRDVPVLDGIEISAMSGVDLALVENPLSPGKAPHLKINAVFDAKGSYLATADGLRLRQISQRAHLVVDELARARTGNSLGFYEYDGAAWDEFSIEGAKNMMAFDAGEFEMTADGEKAHTEKPAEPPDL